MCAIQILRKGGDGSQGPPRPGFSVPPLLPSERWALTPPFHPYLCRRYIFCGTFRPPGIGSGCLPLSEDTLPCDVRTFLYASRENTATTRTRTARQLYTKRLCFASLNCVPCIQTCKLSRYKVEYCPHEQKTRCHSRVYRQYRHQRS